MGWLISIVIWVFLSILVGKFWENRGREFSGGLMISLFLSPLLGFVIGAALQPLGRKKCPECGEFVKEEVTTYKHCGHKFSEMKAEKKVEEKVAGQEGERKPRKEIEDKVRFCLSCGLEILETDKFCPQCGKKVSTEMKFDRQTFQKIRDVFLGIESKDLRNLFLDICNWCKKQGAELLVTATLVRFMKGNLDYGQVEPKGGFLDFSFSQPGEKHISVKLKEDLETVKKYWNKVNKLRCEKCGVVVDSKAKFCPECGHRLEAKGNNIIFCPYCGTKNPADVGQCQKCNADLTKISKPSKYECEDCGSDVPEDAKYCPKCGAALED
ncbi:zinc ribbon domain-containing protein [candidate division WOR-3 bacterium]|nr:zinc ribbon domain-containing protein [candidate division WOR-3 bacterium]